MKPPTATMPAPLAGKRLFGSFQNFARAVVRKSSEAVQLKLDELIRATKTAHNSLLDIEELSETDLDKIKARFELLARKARAELAPDTGVIPPGPSQTA
jgi:low affinity Fe/Cu permease